MHLRVLPVRARLRAFIATLLTIVLAGAAALSGAVSASAAPGDPEYLTVTKSVSASTISVDEPFTYTITVNCSEASCLDANLHDAFPAELAGYAVQNVTMQPSESSVPRDVTWTVGGQPSDAAPDVLTADTVLDVDFTGAVTSPAGTGLQNGSTFTVLVTLQAPDDAPPGEHTAVNVAETTATNSAPDTAEATVTLVVPSILDVEVSKVWSPTPQTFAPGTPSSVTLGATNASNGPVETLVLQEPAAAPDGATDLDPSNPFTITDLSGLSGATMPAGATAVQVDVYVQQSDGSWAWATGPPAATPTLPDGVAPGDVAGVRLTYTGEAIAEGTGAGISLDLVQRATHRGTDADLSTEAHAVTNVVAGSAAVEHIDEPATDTATATYTVNPVAMSVAVEKSIDPARIAAGDRADASLTATNTSDGGMDSLRIADLDYFTEDVTFGGFTAAPTWPAGATSAVVLYHPLDGGEPVEVPFADEETPAAPTAPISGFELVFTAPDGGIEPAATTAAPFTIVTSENAVAVGESMQTTNTAAATVTAPNGRTAEDTAEAPLEVVAPAVDVELAKTIRPSSAVAPGETVVTQLAANLTTTSDYVTADRIVVEDAWTGDGGFWDAFDLTSVAPTQVPSGAALTVEARLPDGTWTTLQVFDAQPGPFLASLSAAEIDDALPAGVARTDLTGIRFTFDAEDAAGFPSDTTVTPYVVSTARGDLRSGGDIPQTETTYQNVATTTGTGTTPLGTDLVDEADDTGEAVVDPGAGIGEVGIDKRWNQPTVVAQSDQQRTTTLSWSVAPGYGGVVLSDPAAPAAPQDTVFEAFDLVRVNPIGASDTPFNNGWYLKYDKITGVELFRDGAWQPVAPPAGGWQSADGSFVGYLLTAEERAQSTGVRVTLAENVRAREAAATTGEAYDPYAPAPGTGVATSSSARTLDLTWQIRDTMRPSGDWVTDVATYNTADAGTVDNTAGILAIPVGGGTPVTDEGSDEIVITNAPPGVTVAKAVDPTTDLYVPMAGTDASRYPTATFTLTAQNDSVSKASYVRVTDPPACTDAADIELCQSAGTAAGATADPFTADIDWLTAAGLGNPFDRFDLTGIRIGASIADQVDLAATTVWLLRYADGGYTTEQTTAAAAVAMDAAQLADVVGISVTFQDADPAVDGGSITADNRLTVELDTVLRTTIRSTGEPQTVAANDRVSVPNRVFAQSYDPILNDGAVNGAQASATPRLTGGDVNVAPTKSVAPDALTEPTRDTPVTVTLGANQGSDPRSTLPPAEVHLTDDVSTSPDFWNTFDLTGLGALDAPAGADRVEVSVYGPFGPDGELTWVESAKTPVGEATIPVTAEEYDNVQGIAFTFSRADGGFFSDVFPAPSWSTTAAFTVQLRETYRDSGAEVALNGEVENTVTVVSDRLNGESSEAKATSAVIDLSLGTFALEVNKLANNGNHTASPGQSVPWDLTFRNAGTGYLTITELRDSLPAHLEYLGEDPVHTGDDDGLLGTDVAVAQDGRDLVFTWPEGERRMAPGETFTVRIMLELQPGLATGEHATNTMTVRTAEELAGCGNIEGGGSTTDAWTLDPSTCGTTDYVTPSVGPNLFTVKGVRGALAGATNPNNPAQVCAPSLTATGGEYYRTPCAANSVIGGTDDWVLRSLNAGTVPVEEMVLFDQLPVTGDQMLLSGSARGSVFRPQLLDGLDVTAPEGTTVVVEVTTRAGVCVGTWSGLTTNEPCAQNGEVWVPLEDDTDLSVVTGLRVSLDFGSTQAGALTPGQFVDVTYSTENVPASDANPSGAPSAVPATDSYAWNQFGVKYRNAGADEFNKIAPSAVGVHLLFGSIEVHKEITGPAAGYAPAEFLADVTCTVEGVELSMGDDAVVELTDDNGYSHRIGGIPLGAECVVDEQGEQGSFGESTRSGPVTLSVAAEDNADEEVPAAQVATITNDYAFSGLNVTKQVQTEATAGELGPFDFTLTCETALGEPVTFGDADTLEFTLADGETFTAPADTVPVGATCVVTEVDASAADEIVVVGTNVTDNGDGSATVEVGATPGEVTVTNGYDAGILTVTKVADGAGADLYGAGPFTFTAECTYGEQVLLGETFSLGAGETRTFGTYPASTECAVTETATGGANATVLEPTDGTVTILGPEDQDETVGSAEVIATNTFLLGDLVIDKVVDGPGAALYGSGPFTAQVVCTWDRDGEAVEVALPGDGLVTLNAANGYTAVLSDLLVGTDCTVAEVGTGGATSTAISPADGVVTIVEASATDGPGEGEEPGDGEQPGDGDAVATVVLTNTFEVTSLEVTKVVEGDLDAEGAQGPFMVELQCTWDAGGEQREVSIPGGATRELRAPEALTATFDDLPLGADCTAQETATGGADSTAISVETAGSDPMRTDGTTAEVTLAASADGPPSAVTVTNTFDAPPAGGGSDGGGSDGGSDGGGSDDPNGWLPDTGAQVAWLAGVAALLVLAGMMLVVARRRTDATE
ncbi:hypothetical protein GCM10023169_31180 [Georgenia halophila]|uniref:DUF5979 domain-containing protein n=1 Tax=Georgenia halophila TaxID=620889 RepID=A0ABP8LJ83_9MICO